MALVPSGRGGPPSRSNARSVARRSSARTPSIVTAPFVTAASPRNEPISMWSGPIVNEAGFRGTATPRTVSVLVPMPSISAPIAARHRARSWTCGSHAALRSTVVPRAATAAMRAFSVAVTLARVRTSHLPRRAEMGQQGEHRLDVADVGNVVDPAGPIGEQRGRENGKRRVLVARRANAAFQWAAASDAEGARHG